MDGGSIDWKSMCCGFPLRDTIRSFLDSYHKKRFCIALLPFDSRYSVSLDKYMSRQVPSDQSVTAKSFHTTYLPLFE